MAEEFNFDNANAGPYTLRMMLSSVKPKITYRPAPNYRPRNTSNAIWPEVESARLWTDFTKENLEKMNTKVDRILDKDLDELWRQYAQQHEPMEFLMGRQASKVDGLRVLTQYNALCMQTAVGFFLGHEMSPFKGCSLMTRNTEPNGSDTKLPPYSGKHMQSPNCDHYVCVESAPPTVLMIGLVRESRQFCAMNYLRDAEPDLEDNKFCPVRQLAQLCRLARVRYGYVQTENELSVWCFSPSDKADHFNVAFNVIPWSAYGDEQLTTDMALFWICLMGMLYPGHRDIVAEMPPIGSDD